MHEGLNHAKIKYICYDLLRNYYKLTFILDKLVSKEPDLKIKVILLIGLYELIFSKKAKYAVVNDLVNLSLLLNKQEKNKKFY